VTSARGKGVTVGRSRPDPYHRGVRSSALGLVTNLLLALAKLLAGFLGHSQALIADAIESLGDVFGSVAVWQGLEIASRPPDQDHPYGHGRAEPIAAALVALLLLGAAVVVAVESVHQIALPQQGPAPFTLVVLLGVILVKEGLFRFLLRVGDRIGSRAVHTDAWHHRSDAITSAAAAVGIAIALIGGPGYESADDWAAVFASGIIVMTGVRLLRPAVQELMDRYPGADLVETTTRIAQDRPGVHRVEKLLMRKMGLYYLAEMHLEVEPTMSVWEGHEIAHQVKEAIQARLPQIVEITIHVEPAYPPEGVTVAKAKPSREAERTKGEAGARSGPGSP
jgi:cation diffusion facilitator family transporter